MPLGGLLSRARSALESSATVEEASPLEVSAHCLDDAVRDRNIDFASGVGELRLYAAYKRPAATAAVYAVYVAYLALALFERPAQDHLLAPFWATVTLEFAFVCAFLCRLFHEMLLSAGGPRAFWRDPKHLSQAAMLALILVDIVVYTARAEATGQYDAVRWSRPLRPLLAVNLPESRQVRAGFRNIRRTLPEVASVLFLLLSSQALFALAAFKLFGGPEKSADVGGPFFADFGESLWSVYVLVTTANHPNVMMPALGHSRWCAVFFVVCLVVNLYMFMSVFLAVVYNRFRANLKNEVRETMERTERLMDRAFDRAASSSTGEAEAGTGNANNIRHGVDKSVFLQLCQRSACLRRRPPEYVEALWLVLDPDGRGSLSRRDFGDLAELLKMPFTDITPRENVFERFIPTFYDSKFSHNVRALVRHRRFRHVFDVAIVVNAIFIGADVLEGVSEQIFLMLFTAEILLKVYTFGPVAFSRKLWNIFDTLVVGSAVVILLAQSVSSSVKTGPALDFLMVLRVTRIFKVFHGIARFKVIINTLLHILPSLATYGSVLFVIYYSFAVAGMAAFAGKIQEGATAAAAAAGAEDCGAAALRGSEFAAEGYCPNNFNHLSASLTTLFELMVVNQWHVIAEGHALAAGSKWARLFFLAFHLTCVIVVLNIFTAFVLEAFILEYSASRRKVRSHLAERIYRMGLAHGQYNSFINNNVRDPSTLETQVSPAPEQKHENFDADHESDSALEDIFQFQKVESTPRQGNQSSVGAPPSTSSSTTTIACPPSWEGYSTRTPIRFHLTFRARSVQHLLERMFEGDLRRDSEQD